MEIRGKLAEKQERAAFAKAFPTLAAATPAIDEPGMANGH